MIDFLIILGFIWVLVASIEDIRKREVENWICFSLIIVALVYRAVFSIINSDVYYFVYGLMGLGIFVVLAYVFYYGRVFAGGDAKLLMGMGAVLPVYASVYSNLFFLGIFVLALLFSGSLYGLVYSMFLVIGNWKNFSKDFLKQTRKYKLLIWISIAIAVVSLIVPVILAENVLFFIPLIIFIFPFLFVYGKMVEESCMIVELKASELTEGDWLYESVKVGRKTIKPYWEGLDEEDLKLLKNYRGKVKVKQGIPFVPGFLLALLALIWFGEKIFLIRGF